MSRLGPKQLLDRHRTELPPPSFPQQLGKHLGGNRSAVIAFRSVVKKHDGAVSHPAKDAACDSVDARTFQTVPPLHRPTDEHRTSALGTDRGAGTHLSDRRTKELWTKTRGSLDGVTSAFDVGSDVSGRLERVEALMLVAVHPERMPAFDDLLHDVGVRLHLATDDEERGARVRSVERREHAPRAFGIGAIVEGEGDASVSDGPPAHDVSEHLKRRNHHGTKQKSEIGHGEPQGHHERRRLDEDGAPREDERGGRGDPKGEATEGHARAIPRRGRAANTAALRSEQLVSVGTRGSHTPSPRAEHFSTSPEPWNKPGTVLFNTLAYAKFFAIVFVVAWVLVHRRHALLLPWFALAIYAVAHPSLSAGAIAAAAFGLTLELGRRMKGPAETDEGPQRLDLKSTVLAVFINLLGLGFLTIRQTGLDPISLGLSALGVPIASLGAATWAVGFLGATLLVALVRARKVRLLFILGASYVFYAHWDFRFLPLIWGSSTADWLLGHAIGRERDPRKRKLWLIGTVILNLGVLGIFKYFNFGIDSMSAALAAFGVDAPQVALRIALPIGVSFFTFESMSYVIDVYRGELEPQKSYLEYLSFVAFFPHLVAGPIVRPRDLLPQLAGPARWSSAEASEGIFLITTGLLKKVVISDYLALNLVDRVFDAPMMYSSVECYAAIVGYALQIYCDFSAYSEIARGSARIFGIDLMRDFDQPYLTSNISDFWRRWHISLSTWLRDYLYIPLGGNRKGKVRTYINLMLTMLLGGLWHGASWTFVVWGGLHGAALAIHKGWHDLFGRKKAEAPKEARSPWSLGHMLGVVATFHFVCACWVFFRAETFAKAKLMFFQLGGLTTHHQNLYTPVLVVLAVGLLTHFVPERLYQTARDGFVRLPAPAQGFALFVAAVALRQMASSDAVPFVYFQF